MQESYLDYAMSVIVSRALPDVRDGLKPVHRRILYAMHEMGLRHNIKFRKSAAIVGDALGKYHPHGDIAVYDSLARMAQNFSLRYPLVDGQGNWGSVDGDAPAAMRYTECRMTRMAEEMLKDIEKDTVSWMANYDATRQEPKVFPASVPQLLINGTMGIAVGMATNIPPHNISEVMDALIYIIDNPNASVGDIFRFIKGPDFPTGGIIFGRKNTREAYAQGRGPIVTRGAAEIKEGSERAGVTSPFFIEITEIPYQVNKSVMIEKIAELVKDGRIEGIKDVRDESDKDGMSVVIEVKKDAHPQKILNALYKFTELQKTFHLNMLALVDGIQPQVLSLRDVLVKYFEHRKDVVRRRIEFDLARAKERAHILEGLTKALGEIDAVIRAIKASQDRADAHRNLRKKFGFSSPQADAILEMRLQTLANLEQKKIEEELKEKKKAIKEFMLLLADKKAFLTLIKEEFLSIKERYGDERRTKIEVEDARELQDEDLIPKEETIITLTRGGYIKRVAPATYKTQKRGGKGIIGMETRGEDVVEHSLACSTHDRLLFFTARGKVYQTLAYEIPKSTRVGRGKALPNFLDLERDDFVTALLSLERIQDASQSLVMATKYGIVKKTPLADFENVRRSGIQAIHLRADDILRWVGVTYGKNEILLVSAGGQAIRFREQDVRPMGRAASGVRGIHLKNGDELIAMSVIFSRLKYILILSENGFGKRTALSHFKVQRRGGVGVKAAKVTPKTGKIAQSMAMEESGDELIAVSARGQVIRTPLKNISVLGRTTQGVKIMRLNAGDKVASAMAV